jgi:DNA-binding NarL/FixJ family response regulator
VVSVTTVRTHIRGILTKLEVGTQLAATTKATDAGWRPPA